MDRKCLLNSIDHSKQCVILIFNYVYVNLPEGSDHPRAGITGVCEQPDRDARKQGLVQGRAASTGKN